MAFSVSHLLDMLVPKERGSRRLVRNLAYGSETRQRLDIYAPREQAGPLPVIVFFYGGAWSTGDKDFYGFAGRALAAQGYVVVVPDYRVVPEVEYPVFLEDCALALRFVAEVIGEHGGDAKRLALAGHSAGAYNAMMLALDERYELPPIACVAGISGPYDFFPFDGPISIRVFGAVREPERTQPINHVSAAAPPVLLLHGEKDRLVAPRNSVMLAEKLRLSGVSAEERYYPRRAHVGMVLALALPGRWLAPVLADLSRFFRLHLSEQVRTDGPEGPGDAVDGVDLRNRGAFS